MIGIIGGTGLTQLRGLEITERKWLETPYGEPSAAVSFGHIAEKDKNGQHLAFLARHGDPHHIPPHLINYRANISALQQVGVNKIVAVYAVGGIHPLLGPAELAVPDQIIDYTYGREHTLFDSGSKVLEHVDFSFPYDQGLRSALIRSAQDLGITVLPNGTYGATQGPRLESAAEIQRYKRDGCDMIGMTGMPEAALAREYGIEFASLALSVNWAAGLSKSIITMEDIERAIEQGMGKVHQILRYFLTT